MVNNGEDAGYIIIKGEIEDKDLDKDQQSEKLKSEIQQIIGNQIRVSQILSIILYLGILNGINFINFINQELANWFMVGEFALTEGELIYFLINLSSFMLIILIIYYYPRMSKIISTSITAILVGAFIAVILNYLLTFYEIDLNNKGSEFPLTNLLLFIIYPLGAIFITYPLKHKNQYLFYYIMFVSLFISLAIFWIIKNKVYYINLDIWLILLILGFQITLLISHGSVYKTFFSESS